MRTATVTAIATFAAAMIPMGALARSETYAVNDSTVQLTQHYGELEVHGHDAPDLVWSPLSEPGRLYAYLVGRAKQHMKQGQLRAAIEELTRAAGLQPRQPYVRRVLGYALMAWGDYKGASVQFRRMMHTSDRPLHLCIDWEQDFPIAHMCYVDIVNNLRAARDRAPNDPDLNFCLGFLRNFDGREGKWEAKEIFARDVEVNPADADAQEALRVIRRPRVYIGE